MKSLYHYLAESAKSYKYRVKSVVPMDQHFIDTLKTTLFKYDIQSVSSPKKLMAQNAPLDFKNLSMAEIYILDVVTSIPASSYVLAVELRGALKLPDADLVVRGENEPMELEAQKIEEILKDDQESIAMLQDETYSEADQPKEVAYGDAYNKKFLNYLAQLKSDAENVPVPAIEEVKKSNKFAWLNKKDTTIAGDFNADMDTVKPVHVNSKKPGAKAEKPNLAAVHGNYDENVKRKG
jgi:hypothetical protein